MLNNILCITKKELGSYFNSMVAYVGCTVFLGVCGILFYKIVNNASLQSLKLVQMQREAPLVDLHDVIFRPTFHNMIVILLLIVPILTMKLFAGEHRSRTMELLLTSPVSVAEIVCGKFLGAVGVLFLLLIMTTPFPIMMNLYRDVDWMAQLSGYIGVFLTGSLFISIGLFASALTKNQLIAALYSLGMLLFFWMIGFIANIIENQTIYNVVIYISTLNHLENFQRGLLNSRDLIYYFSSIFFVLFLTQRVIDSHRWK